MDRSEPSLVPEWLKSSGSVASGGTLRPHSSSSSHSDDHPGSKLARNKSSSRSIDQDLGRSPGTDRVFSRRSYSSNGSAQHSSYSNFGRNYHGREWDKDIYEPQDKNRKVFGDHKERDDSPRGIFSGRFEKDGLRRSHSMIPGRRSEIWPKKPSAVSTPGINNDDTGAISPLKKSSYDGGMHKPVIEKEFPPLGSVERQDALEIGRVPSPGLSSVIHPLKFPSTINGSDKWTSALAEVPAVVGSSGSNISLAQQNSVSCSSAPKLSTITGLNMAETVAQGPRAQTAPQVPTGSQRLEELAIKQSRQLIPVTPAMPKPLVMNSSDKVKAGRVGQPQHSTSSLLSPSARSGPVKADSLKISSAGNLQVLKPARERNSVSVTAIDSLIPKSTSKAGNSPAVASSVAGSSTSRGLTTGPVSPTAQGRHVSTVLEKRPTSQAQSRSDFYNLVRKKSMGNSSVSSDTLPGQVVSSPSMQVKPGEREAVTAPPTPQVGDVPPLDSQCQCVSSGSERNLICKDDAFQAYEHPRNGKTRSIPDPIFSEEEEAAFLRSLGWEENSDEDVLTEEEISAFYQDMTKYLNSKPSLKFLQGVQPRFSLSISSQAGNVADAVSQD